MDNYDWQHLVLTWSIVFVFKQLLNGNKKCTLNYVLEN